MSCSLGEYASVCGGRVPRGFVGVLLPPLSSSHAACPVLLGVGVKEIIIYPEASAGRVSFGAGKYLTDRQ